MVKGSTVPLFSYMIGPILCLEPFYKPQVYSFDKFKQAHKGSAQVQWCQTVWNAKQLGALPNLSN